MNLRLDPLEGVRLPKQLPEEGFSGESLVFGQEYMAAKARESFLQFRLFMNPGLIRGWWWELNAEELENFYWDIIDGKRPSLMIFAPPQHGKSEMVSDFIAWVLGRHPEWPAMFCSYAEDLCTRCNGKMQRYFLDPRYQLIFPKLFVKGSIPEGLEVVNRAELLLNTDAIILAKYRIPIGHDNFMEVGGGSFRSPTVAGQATGFGYMLGAIDDPIKGRAEANSSVIRNKVWDWLTETFLSRKADQAGLLMTVTRWHKDDPAARFLDKYPETRIISFPAIAAKNEYLRRGNERVLLRKKGDPLFPEHKSLDFLKKQKRGLTQAGWEAIYQQSPFIQGGGEFPIENFGPIPSFNRSEIQKSVRYWDKAGTEDGGKYTAGVLMHKLRDGTYIIEHGLEGQWGALKRERNIKQTAINDGKKVIVYVEQEPGSGGKESAEATVRMLAGWKAYADKVSDSKEARGEPYAAAVQNGDVKCIIPKDPSNNWFRSFVEQHEVWPNGPLKDWVDAAAGAFNKLAASNYDTSYKWL